MTNLITIGMALLFIAIFLIFIGTFLEATKAQTPQKPQTKVAVGGFIGPFPFGFANDRNMLWIIIAITGIFFLLWIIFNLKLLR